MFQRLGKNTEFKKVYNFGRWKSNRDLVMVVLKCDSSAQIYGFSVSKKVGNSVVRHRITRQLREIANKNVNNIKVGYKIVVIAKPEVAGKKFDEINKSFLHLCRLQGIMR